MIRAILSLGLVAAALAQNSIVDYDPSKPATKQGIVTKVDWQVPHVLVHFDVKDQRTGTIESWVAEMGPPHLARNYGWAKGTLKVGEGIHGGRDSCAGRKAQA